MSEFEFTEILPLGKDETEYRLVTTHGVSTFETPQGTFLKVSPEAITRITQEALREIAERHGPDERIAVVSHGAALGVALGTLLDNDPGRWTRYQFANCSLTELVLSPAPYVNFFNQTFHL